MERNIYKIGKELFITSDEEIKERDWCIDKHNVVYKQETDKIFTKFNGVKKIILTTDQDLIADGVQAIDDEFLEWFVKNPSCEEVEVIKIDVEQPKPLYPNGNHKGERVWIEQYKIIIPQLCKIGCDKLILNGINSICCGDKDYKIIIPQEEPKQEYYCKACGISQDEPFSKCHESHKHCSCEIRLTEEHKQETLEEANWKVIGTKNDTFYNGAKWQQERMYSEEDLISFAHFYFTEEFNSSMQTSKSTKDIFNEWFEQFKKK
jgi:hypothetical protein